MGMLGNFFIMSGISILAIFVSWISMYEILGKVWTILPRLPISPRLRVLVIGIPIFAAHILGIWLYALIYFCVENYTTLGAITGINRNVGVTMDSFFDCLYFSGATYTSLGLGDLLPTGHIRMLVAAEVLDGLVMIGWTVSFTFLTMEKFWLQPHKHTHKD